jgi:hypothetical protein
MGEEMTFREIVERARARAVETIRKLIEERRSTARVHVEPALRLKNIAYAPDGLKLPLRWDIYAEGEAGGKNADSVTIKFSEPVFATWSNDMKIQILDICWDCVRFQLSPASSESDWRWLSAWFFEWFDLEDKNQKSEEGLYGAVHFISDPEVCDGSASFIVDFGSAPVEAFDRLLYLIADHGYATCVIGKEEPAQGSEPVSSED